jgi:Arc/MetJ-type ribon-helix-helix transcriptional regulator
MARPITSADLPERFARFAEAEVAAGHFSSVEDVVEAGLTMLQQRMERHDTNDAAPEEAEPTTPAPAPFWTTFTAQIHALPDEVFERLPKDGASEVDHYLTTCCPLLPPPTKRPRQAGTASRKCSLNRRSKVLTSSSIETRTRAARSNCDRVSVRYMVRWPESPPAMPGVQGFPVTEEIATAFCRQVRARTREHRAAIDWSNRQQLPSISISVLPMELDSMIRTIFVWNVLPDERTRLLQASVDGTRWTISSPNGKPTQVTDRMMVDLAQQLHGWTKSVYQFGCAFVHLSSFHDHGARDPIAALDSHERNDLLKHLRAYHGGPARDDFGLADIIPMLPAVFEKIAGNLECYLKELEGAGHG